MNEVYNGDWFVSTGEDGHVRYGIRLFLTNGAVWEIPDIDCDLNKIPQLLDRLRGERIDEEQLRYILEDYVADAYLR